jgi:hypothetical protein
MANEAGGADDMMEGAVKAAVKKTIITKVRQVRQVRHKRHERQVR